MEIQISNLKKQYGDNTVLDIEALTIQSGELVGLVGNNGAGKTTLMRLMLDLIQSTEGEVLISGNKVCDTDVWKNWVGSFIDGSFLIDFYTPEEYFEFIAKVYHIQEPILKQRLAEFYDIDRGEILGTNKLIKDFSQGNKQKIGIIGAMIIAPKVLILDEPFNYLDPSSQIFVAKKIQNICSEKGTTVLISSHNIQFIADISTRILLLEKGKVVNDISNKDGNILKEMNEYFGQK